MKECDWPATRHAVKLNFVEPGNEAHDGYWFSARGVQLDANYTSPAPSSSSSGWGSDGSDEGSQW
jgi:hypothetical protein